MSKKHDALLIGYYDLNEKWSQIVEPLRIESQATRQHIGDLLSERSHAEAHAEELLSEKDDGAPQRTSTTSRNCENDKGPGAKASTDLTKSAKRLAFFRRKPSIRDSGIVAGPHFDQEAAPSRKEILEKKYENLEGRYTILQQRDQKWKKLELGYRPLFTRRSSTRDKDESKYKRKLFWNQSKGTQRHHQEVQRVSEEGAEGGSGADQDSGEFVCCLALSAKQPIL